MKLFNIFSLAAVGITHGAIFDDDFDQKPAPASFTSDIVFEDEGEIKMTMEVLDLKACTVCSSMDDPQDCLTSMQHICDYEGEEKKPEFCYICSTDVGEGCLHAVKDFFVNICKIELRTQVSPPVEEESKELEPEEVPPPEEESKELKTKEKEMTELTHEEEMKMCSACWEPFDHGHERHRRHHLNRHHSSEKNPVNFRRKVAMNTCVHSLFDLCSGENAPAFCEKCANNDKKECCSLAKDFVALHCSTKGFYEELGRQYLNDSYPGTKWDIKDVWLSLCLKLMALSFLVMMFAFLVMRLKRRRRSRNAEVVEDQEAIDLETAIELSKFDSLQPSAAIPVATVAAPPQSTKYQKLPDEGIPKAYPAL